MKTKLSTIGTLLVLGLMTFNARAIILFQDDFNSYGNGALTNSTWVAGFGNTLNAQISVNGGAALIAGFGSSALPRAYFTNAPAGTPSAPGAPNFPNTFYYFPTNSPTLTLYYSFTLNIGSPPGVSNNTYIAYLTDTNFSFVCRATVLTNNVSSGKYRIGVSPFSASLSLTATNSSGVRTNVVQQDLSYGTTYTIVARYVLGTGLCTLWVNPDSETNTVVAANATLLPPLFGTVNGTTNNCLAGFGLRNAAGTGPDTIDNVIVGTTFADVVPGSANPPTILVQPQDNLTAFEGQTVSFNTLASGDLPLSYQWYYNTNTPLSDQTGVGAVIGSTSNVLTLTNIVVGQSGTYSCVVTNLAGGSVAGSTSTRFAGLLVSLSPIAPVITNEPPAAQTNITGDTVIISVIAGGIPLPSYQWKVVTNNGVSNFTNNVSGANVAGTNTATLTITGVTTNQSGSYFVTITNVAGSTNSTQDVLTVNPPPLVSIATLHTLLDTNTWAVTNTTAPFRVQGIVTTWTNMTSSGSPEFYIQDASGGIVVFWSGAGGTNTPPVGTLVQITGPMAQFSGLLELEPVFGNPLLPVTMISSNNPLPTPQPLPFDPNITANEAVMQQLEGSYFVVSNVFLDFADGANFTANASDPMTNILTQTKTFTNSVLNLTFTNGAGQTFVLFVNSHSDIPGQAKPTGPVTVFGVLGKFVSTSPFVGGYEFTPRGYADIIAYTRFTNVLENLTRLGDQPTNSFTESVLRPTEKLTMNVSLSDPLGGTVSIAPVPTGLPVDASWTINSSGGQTATATFRFQPTSGDAGTNYIAALQETTGTGIVTNSWYIYVPTPQEQQIYISEFLANPTTTTNSPAFNPLQRAVDTNNISVNDQYVEIVNVSTSNVESLYGWSITDASTLRHVFGNTGSESLTTSNSYVVYGGVLNNDPDPPTILGGPSSGVQIEPASSGSLALSGVITLRNTNYFNNGSIQPGYIVDRVVYNASSLASGSLSRFPTLNSGFVPQQYISTNWVTPGLQYDGGRWTLPTQRPQGVNNIVVTAGNPLKLGFTAAANQASTLWNSSIVNGQYGVIFGQTFTNTTGAFFITNPVAPAQFYYITTQTNTPPPAT